MITAAELDVTQKRPLEFKKESCLQKQGLGCRHGRLCSKAHGARQLRSAVLESRRENVTEDVAYLEMRSRVHLTLCWVSGHTLWVDDFPRAYSHVTGRPLETPGGGSRCSFSFTDALEAFLDDMSPHTCETFVRFDEQRGENRMAVTLARGA